MCNYPFGAKKPGLGGMLSDAENARLQFKVAARMCQLWDIGSPMVVYMYTPLQLACYVYESYNEVCLVNIFPSCSSTLLGP